MRAAGAAVGFWCHVAQAEVVRAAARIIAQVKVLAMFCGIIRSVVRLPRAPSHLLSVFGMVSVYSVWQRFSSKRILQAGVAATSHQLSPSTTPAVLSQLVIAAAEFVSGTSARRAVPCCRKRLKIRLAGCLRLYLLYRGSKRTLAVFHSSHSLRILTLSP